MRLAAEPLVLGTVADTLLTDATGAWMEIVPAVLFKGREKSRLPNRGMMTKDAETYETVAKTNPTRRYGKRADKGNIIFITNM
ncbi:hypothetical protein LTR35_000416 [Friedmanniomyces endolithicus]|uniref:Uncharacterized protein n=1 Tax=Friedmanniomyces endolithicus TaxID=329885 RepID=A0AAN6FVZ2_9PEZI|nr:hypothetical protein LTS00_009258 [Friedmanniomyces endolithicus]KAK0293809.1 hypothetical protein LTR35_000416 [Friedmanniomyces endolithicus]KAK0324324.1 hypothetical protein LTR82_004763 [Friedmanniomyces endolithicus]KAK0972520.1 hypothetical protein LTR54_017552 [Friedmanniomyces endolithicus]